jgi:hypothetical protein
VGVGFRWSGGRWWRQPFEGAAHALEATEPKSRLDRGQQRQCVQEKSAAATAAGGQSGRSYDINELDKPFLPQPLHEAFTSA